MSIAMMSSRTRGQLKETKQDKQQIERIFREHYALVFRTAYGVTGSPEDSEDAVQTIFLRLIRREFPPQCMRDPRAYLYRAAVNLSLNTMKRRQRDILTNDSERFEETAHASWSDPVEELHTRLYEAIAELDADSSEILILRYVHEYRNGEIAKLLGKSRAFVAVRLFRARTQLKQFIRASQHERLRMQARQGAAMKKTENKS